MSQEKRRKTRSSQTQSKNSQLQAKKRRKKQQEEKKKPFNLTLVIGGGVIFCILLFVLNLFFNRPGVISGKVVDFNTDQEIKNVRVSLDGQFVKDINELTSSFMLSNIPAGAHQVTFEHQLYEPKTETVQLRSGETIKLKVALNLKKLQTETHGDYLVIATKGAIWFKERENLADAFRVQQASTAKDLLILGKTIYTADFDKDRLSLIDLESKSVRKSLELPPHSGPAKLALSNDQKTLYVLNSIAKNITRLDLEKEVFLPDPLSFSGAPHDFHVTETDIYVLTSQGIAVVKEQGTRIFEEIPVPGLLGKEIHYLADSSQAVIPNGQEILLVDVRGGEPQRFPLKTRIETMLVDTVRNEYYLGQTDGLSIFSPTSGDYREALVNDVGGGIKALQFSPDGSQLFISSTSPLEIAVLKLEDLSIVQKKSMVEEATDIAFVDPN